MKSLVFTDFDGVLNDNTAHPELKFCTIDKDKAFRFNRILAATGAEFVVTSAWRYNVHGGGMTMDGFRNLLFSHWVDARRLVGITRRDVSPEETDRGEQIREWLGGGKRPYVVLDNGGEKGGLWTDLGIVRARHPVVWTRTEVGLTDGDADYAIKVLNGQQGDG